MTLAQIQRAASRPMRWDILTRKGASPFEPWASYPSARRNLDDHPAIASTLVGEFLPLPHWRMHLVPGGKFLVVLSLPHFNTGGTPGGEAGETTPIVISVYDLGAPGCVAPCSPRIVASLSFDIAGSAARAAVMATSSIVIISDALFRIVIVHPNGTKRLQSWIVLAFDVEFREDGDGNGRTASVKQREASITIGSPRRRVLSMCLQGGCVLLRFPESVIIWDMEALSYSSVKEPDLGPTIESRHRLSVLTSSHIISIGVEKMVLWDISALDWTGGGPSLHIEEASARLVAPDIVIPDPWNHKAWDGIQFYQVPTPAVTDNRVYIDVQYSPQSNNSAVRYQLDITPCPPLPPSRHDLQILAGQKAQLDLTLISATRFPIPRLRTDPSLACGQVCYLYGGAPDVTSYAYVPRYRPAITLMTPERLKEESGLTLYARLGVDTPYAFCVLSGRMIYVQSLRGGREQNVKVVDYLT